MAYLITGATGIVGSEICRLCADQGISVHYLTTQKNKIKNTPTLKGFYWNIEKQEIDNAAFNGVTKIIHLAGASIAKRWTSNYKKEILNSRVNSANLLFNYLKNNTHTVNQFISASATGIYLHSYTNLYTEKCIKKDARFLGKVVNTWEQNTDQFSNLGLTVTKIRIGLVLSNKGGILPKICAPIRYFVGAAFGNGEQWQSWIHTTDLAQIFLFTATNNNAGVYNAVAPNPVKQNKLIKLCAKRLHKPLFLPNIPNFVLKIIFGSMSELLLNSQRISPSKIQNLGFSFKYPNVEKAIEDLLK